MDKTRVIERIREINAQTDSETRKNLCDKLIDYVYPEFKGKDLIMYLPDTDVISLAYVNFDSNSGLTVVTACEDLARIARAIAESDDITNNFDLDHPVKSVDELEVADIIRIINEDDDRREYWEDLIDEDYYFKKELTEEEAVEIIWVIYESNGAGAEEAMMRVLKEQVYGLSTVKSYAEEKNR